MFTSRHRTDFHYRDRRAVRDAVSEASPTREELRAAFYFIPGEFVGYESDLAERFEHAVIRNAVAVNRSPYTVALFALDVA